MFSIYPFKIKNIYLFIFCSNNIFLHIKQEENYEIIFSWNMKNISGNISEKIVFYCMANCLSSKLHNSEIACSNNFISMFDGNVDFQRSLTVYQRKKKSHSQKFDVGRMNQRSKYFQCNRSASCFDSERSCLANDRSCSWVQGCSCMSNTFKYCTDRSLMGCKNISLPSWIAATLPLKTGLTTNE